MRDRQRLGRVRRPASLLLLVALVAVWPALRAPDAAAAFPRALSIEVGGAPAHGAVVRGERVSITGKLPPAAARPVRLQLSVDDGSWRVVESDVSDRRGRFDFSVAIPSPATAEVAFRVKAPATTIGGAAAATEHTHAHVLDVVEPHSSLWGPRRAMQGTRFGLDVRLYPWREGRQVVLQRRSGGVWREVARSREVRGGTAGFKVSARTTGDRTFRAVAPAAHGAPRVVTPKHTITVVTSGDVEAPEHPQDIRAFVDDGEVRLTWRAVPAPDVSGYHAYYGPTQYGPWIRATSSTVPGTRYTDLDTPAPDARWYSITSVDTSGNESWHSSGVRSGTDDYTAPPVPERLAAAGRDTEVELSWDEVASGDLAGYQVYRADSRNGPWTAAGGPVSTTSTRVTGLPNAVRYWFSVVSLDRSGNESERSEPLQEMARDASIPPQPTALVASSTSPAQVDLDWTDVEVEDLAGYRVYRASSADGPWQQLTDAPIAGSRFIDDGLLNDVRYWYVITAEDTSENESAASPAADAAPRGLTFSAPERLGTGTSFSCRIRADARLQCWGHNRYGQLGDGTTVPNVEPTVVGDDTWSTLAVGAEHACGIQDDSSLWCWGANGSGQLGNDSGSRNAPSRVGSETGWVDVDAGEEHTCAVRGDGSLWCWGYGFDGRLGVGYGTEARTPLRVGNDNDWVELSAGGAHTCALRSNGTLWCWGRNRDGQIADTTNDDDVREPQQVGSEAGWTAVSAGAAHTCGIRSGSTWCWGSNHAGQLGVGTRTSGPEPRRVGIATDWRDVSAGGDHTCASRVGGRLWCWGQNQWGEVGDGTADNVRETPTPVDPESRWSEVHAGTRDHTCGIALDGSTACWGYYGFGELGNGQTAFLSRPSEVSGLPDDVTHISHAWGHSCALTAGRSIWCWGYNSKGQLGDGTTTSRFTPAAVDEAGSWRAVTTGLGHSCALRTGGTAWCWGAGAHGKLGNGSDRDSAVPTRVGTESDWAVLSAGPRHTCGIRSAGETPGGSLWCWGWMNGKSVHGVPEDSAVPVQVGDATDWTSVSVADLHTCGTRADGSMWCWGGNHGGQAGYPYDDWVAVPWQVGKGASWSDVTTGDQHSCGLRTDDTLWCWGANDWGQLGVGVQGGESTDPIQVREGGEWTSVAAGSDSTCGVRKDGSAWCWGSDTYGELGDGGYVQEPALRVSPVEVAGGLQWDQVSSEHQGVCGRDQGGGVHCWGWNHKGGLGKAYQQTTPAPILE